MSIVICAVYNNSRLFFGSDTRAIKNNIVNDDFKKIFNIRPDIYLGMTGEAEPGFWYIDRIKQLNHLDTISLLNWIELDFPTHNFPKLAIILAGKDEQGNFFIYSQNHEGLISRPFVPQKDLVFTVSANANISLFGKYFERCFINGIEIKQAIQSTISYASTIDPSISDKCDLVILD